MVRLWRALGWLAWSSALRGWGSQVARAQQGEDAELGDWGQADGKGWSCTARAIEAECKAAADDDWLRSNPPSGGRESEEDAGAFPSADLLACLRGLCPHLGDPVDVCSGDSQPIEAQMGLMYDGTAGWGYSNGLDCSREVRVPEGQDMSFIFIEWRLHDAADWVAIYDTASDHAIFSNAGLWMPTLHAVHVESGQARVLFHTDSSQTDRGWTAVWVGERMGCMQPESPLFEAEATGEPEHACLVPVCPGASGEVDVGTYRRGQLGIAPYTANLRCGKTLSANPGERIALSFSHWDVYDAEDYLSLYDGSDASAPLLGTWTGSDAACHAGRGRCDDTDAPWGGVEHVSSGSSIFMSFVSSARGNGGGWTGNWRTLSICQEAALGRGWSTTNQTLAVPPQSTGGTDSADVEPQPLLNANGESTAPSATAVEGELLFRECDFEGRVFALCQRDGSWVGALHNDERWSLPEGSPQPPTVCSDRPPPSPAPPLAAGGCPRGSYRNRGQCAECRPGYYQPSDGFRGTECTLCSPGRYRDHTLRASICEICPTGRYGRERGATTCRSCPPGRQTPRAGGTGLTNCSLTMDDVGPVQFRVNESATITRAPPSPAPPATVSASAVPRGTASFAASADSDEGEGEAEDDRSIGLVLWSWFAWAGGASRELFLGLCIISCGCIRFCARSLRKCKDRACGRGSGSGTMSRADRQQQRARDEIGLALQMAAQDDGGYASPVLSRRGRVVHRQDHFTQLVDGFDSQPSVTPAPLQLATFVMDTPQGRHGYTSEQPLMMAETTLNPSVIEADVVTATRTSGR